MFENLTTQQKEKIAGKSPEEILALAKDEGIELTEAQLQEITGGWGDPVQCPQCGSQRIRVTPADIHSPVMIRECCDCGHQW